MERVFTSITNELQNKGTGKISENNEKKIMEGLGHGEFLYNVNYFLGQLYAIFRKLTHPVHILFVS